MFKIQNSERYKNSDQSYKPFKSDRWKSHRGGTMKGSQNPILNRVELSLYDKGHLHICNERTEAFSEHSQTSKKELSQKRYYLKEIGES